jgi:pimeloyl-ACP methyl ester carboxylesterase
MPLESKMTTSMKIMIKLLRAKFKFLSLVSKKKAAKEAFILFCTPLIKSGKRTTPLFNTSEKLQFKVDEYVIKGYRFNHPQKKKAVILHGFRSSSISFEKYVQPLINKGYEVLAFDAPAHGFSSGVTVNAIQYKKMIIKANELYGGFDAYVAHSFGGLAVCLALEKILHTELTKLVLIAPATETSTAIEQAFTLLNIRDEKIKLEFNQIIEAISGNPVSWFSVKRALTNIKASTLWLHDSEDLVTPIKDVEPFIANNPGNVRFEISKGLGHRRVYRSKENIEKVMDFL